MIFSDKENVAEEKLDDKPEVVVSPTSLSSPKKVPQTPASPTQLRRNPNLPPVHTAKQCLAEWTS